MVRRLMTLIALIPGHDMLALLEHPATGDRMRYLQTRSNLTRAALIDMALDLQEAEGTKAAATLLRACGVASTVALRVLTRPCERRAATSAKPPRS